MANKCVVCGSRRYKKSTHSFHRFPKLKELRKQWVEACKINEHYITPDTIVCSKHFKFDDFDESSWPRKTLIAGAVPAPSIYFQTKDACQALQNIKNEASQDFGKSSSIMVSASTTTNSIANRRKTLSAYNPDVGVPSESIIMDIENVMIKMEPQDEDEILNGDGSNDFKSEIAQNCVKTEANLKVEYSPTSFNNEDNNKTTTSSNCNNEPVDSFNNERPALKCPKIKIEKPDLKSPKMEVEDVFDEENLVDLANLKQLLNQSNDMAECSNIKTSKKDKGFDVNRKNLQNGQELSKNCKVDENIDISEFLVQSMDRENISEKQRTSAVDHHLPKQHEIKNLTSNQNSSKRKFSCDFCYKSFSYKSLKDEHLLKYHKEEINDDIESYITTKTHKCNICNYMTVRKEFLRTHISSVHNEQQRTKLNCQYCNKTFLKEKSLEDHMLKQHRDIMSSIKSKIHQCSFCSYQTTHKCSLDSHLRSTHKEEKSKLNCQFCNKSFSFKNSLGHHILTQHKQDVNGDIKALITSKIHTCNVCSYETTIKELLDKHVKLIHTNERTKVNCQFCDKIFGDKKSLDGHILREHKEKISTVTSKIHKCSFCCYLTTYKSGLNAHLDSMHNEHRMKNQCVFCSKSFASKPSLDYHLIKQHEQYMIDNDKTDLITTKIHLCSFCTYKTTVKSELNGHIKSSHKNEKIVIICRKV